MTTINDVDEIDIERMDVNDLRIKMMERGWTSHDKLTHLGWGNRYGYSFWFERFDWHGHNGFGVVFHFHTTDMDYIDGGIKNTARVALTAWNEFTSSVPAQMADGSVQTNAMLTKMFREQRASETTSQRSE